MSRRYKLKHWDADDWPLNDPNAAWRDDPATQRQIRRLRFFGVKVRGKMTKGEAADLIDALEPTIEELEDYNKWKIAGEPNIDQWHRRRSPRKARRTGCGMMIVGIFLISILLALIVPHKRKDTQATKSAIPSPVPSATKDMAATSLPQPSAKDSAIDSLAIPRPSQSVGPHAGQEARLTREVVVSSSAQSPEDKPARVFWPREVQISEEAVLEQRTKYGTVSSKRFPGSVVKVVNLKSELLEVESDGFSGKVKVDKTDFWERANKTRSAAIERQNREKELAKTREEKEAEEKMKAARIKRYQNAAKLVIEIIQVLDDGCLARVLESNASTRKRIFIELRNPNWAEGQRYELRAEQYGTFSYKTVLGAPSTVERWVPVEKP